VGAPIGADEDAAVRLGYSFWGFLGAGVPDTPDGGRSHRRVLLDGLRNRDHDLVLLQTDRDRTEAGDVSTGPFRWDSGFPALDALFLEWRWPIPGRNRTPCGSPGHTCDLHRQDDLLAHYTHGRRTPTLLWDKDQRLPGDDPLRRTPAAVVCEATRHPHPAGVPLLFPVADDALSAADPAALAARPRDLPLVYVGNQYDRDDAFDTFFAPAAAAHPHLVAGKWTCTRRWPHVRFAGRVPFPAVAALHGRAMTTVLLLPDRYAATGQMTQRIIEAVLAGCVPLCPGTVRDAARFVPEQLVVHDGHAVADAVTRITRIAGTPQHADLLRQCLDRLDGFRLSRQLDVIDTVLLRLTTTGPRRTTGALP
jgi:hypothetical protein